jgi:hypothetical protein
LKKRKEIYSFIKSIDFTCVYSKFCGSWQSVAVVKRQKIKLDKHGAIENDKKSAKRLQSRKRCAIMVIIGERSAYLRELSDKEAEPTPEQKAAHIARN